MLRLKFQYLGHLMQKANSGKDRDAGKDWEQEEKGVMADEMVEWHHRFSGHESGQTLGNSEGEEVIVLDTT